MAPERKGGPVDPISNYQQVFESLFKGDKKYPTFGDYPMYKYLAQFSTKAHNLEGDEETK